MKYELWDVIADGSQLIPSIKISESDDFTTIYLQFVDRMDQKMLCVIIANVIKESLVDSDEKIYESPDGGKTIYERTVGNYTERKQIK